MKITIARLRSNVRYRRPLQHIMDCFYDCYNRFQNFHPEFDYGYYNFSWHERPTRNIDEIKSADIVIIPTENEFHFHIDNYIHPLNLKKSNEAINELKPYLKGKKIILFRFDRADSPDYYRNYTFKDVELGPIECLDEDDFSIGISALKYYYMKDSYGIFYDDYEYRSYDFIYWGTDKRKLPGGEKSQDERHIILKQISKLDIESYWIGRFSNIDRNLRMQDMSLVRDYLRKSKFTLCFNWLTNTAITTRYHEALGCGVVPLVWKDYDSTNRLNLLPEQRISSPSQLEELIKGDKYQTLIEKVLLNYEKVVPTEKQVYKEFNKLLLEKIKS